MLDGPIVVIKDPRTEKNRVIDPGHIARQLMGFRSKEAKLVVKVTDRYQSTVVISYVTLICFVGLGLCFSFYGDDSC